MGLVPAERVTKIKLKRNFKELRNCNFLIRYENNSENIVFLLGIYVTSLLVTMRRSELKFNTRDYLYHIRLHKALHYFEVCDVCIKNKSCLCMSVL